jgi:hypothetical protein
LANKTGAAYRLGMRARFGEETPTARRAEDNVLRPSEAGQLGGTSCRKKNNHSLVVRLGEQAVAKADIIASDQQIAAGPKHSRDHRGNNDLPQ